MATPSKIRLSTSDGDRREDTVLDLLHHQAPSGSMGRVARMMAGRAGDGGHPAIHPRQPGHRRAMRHLHVQRLEPVDDLEDAGSWSVIGRVRITRSISPRRPMVKQPRQGEIGPGIAGQGVLVEHGRRSGSHCRPSG